MRGTQYSVDKFKGIGRRVYLSFGTSERNILNLEALKKVYHDLLIFKNKLKGTVRVISSDPPCKVGNTRFTNLPFSFV